MNHLTQDGCILECTSCNICALFPLHGLFPMSGLHLSSLLRFQASLYPISHCFLSVHSSFTSIGIIGARRLHLLVHSYIYNTVPALSYSSDLTESFSQTVTMVDRVPFMTVNYFKDLLSYLCNQMSPEN